MVLSCVLERMAKLGARCGDRGGDDTGQQALIGARWYVLECLAGDGWSVVGRAVLAGACLKIGCR